MFQLPINSHTFLYLLKKIAKLRLLIDRGTLKSPWGQPTKMLAEKSNSPCRVTQSCAIVVHNCADRWYGTCSQFIKYYNFHEVALQEGYKIGKGSMGPSLHVENTIVKFMNASILPVVCLN